MRLVLDRRCTNASARFEPREGGRYCTACESMQYDLRDATRSKALAVLKEHGGRACVRVRVGPSGEPRFAPEPPARGVSALGAAIALTIAACESPASEATHAPVVAAPMPTPVAPPLTTVPVAPPPTTEAPAPREPIDHTSDASPEPADHRRHQHHHAPARPQASDDVLDGGMITMPPGY